MRKASAFDSLFDDDDVPVRRKGTTRKPKPKRDTGKIRDARKAVYCGLSGEGPELELRK